MPAASIVSIQDPCKTRHIAAVVYDSVGKINARTLSHIIVRIYHDERKISLLHMALHPSL
jgi:hypothetical protein